jgi:multidrug transporter EmrE-like cation transporter
MPTFLVLASLYNTVLFRIVFNERIAMVHNLGMLVMIAGIVFLSIETTMKSSE